MVMSARFSRDESLVITASDDGEARIWSTATGEPVGPPLRHGTVPLRLAEISSDGRSALTAAGNKAYVCEIPTGRLLGTVAHPESVLFAELSPRGDLFVTTSEDGAARVWDEATAQLRCEVRSDPARGQTKIAAARFDPAGERIATAADNGSIQLWSSESGDPLGPPFEQESEVLWLEFSPRGDHLVSASGDGTARIWDVPAGAPEDTGRLADLAEAVGGSRIVGGALVPNPQAVETLKKLWKDIAAQRPDETAATAFIRWFLADPEGRPRLP